MSDPAPAYSLRFTAAAESDIQSLDGSIRKQVRKVLEKKLATDPEGYGTPLRAPLDGYWKHEFASHRVVYRIYPAERIVAVCAVGARRGKHARNVYQQLQAMAKAGKLAEHLAAIFKPR